MTKVYLRFDRGPGGVPALFERPREVIVAYAPGEVPGAFSRLEAARGAGSYLAGFASYELGYGLDAALAGFEPQGRDVPLLSFGVFDGPNPAPPLMEDGSSLEGLEPDWRFDRYAQAFDAVKAHIAAGDIYQANLTFALRGRMVGTAEGLYAALSARQTVPHGVLAQFEEATILSRSPELFFALDGAGGLTTRPMKGTAPRGGTAREDAARKAGLAASEKDQAENLMIVDLLRNDMSRISEVGSVKVPELFSVQTYATLHQMTSRITSRMVAGTTLLDLFAALFPCGSVTGAPKIRAMQILSGLEAGTRGAYCGSLGWIAPDGRAEFNVGIRTLTVRGDEVVLPVGGGVVQDSTARAEYDEALLKADFARLAPVISPA